MKKTLFKILGTALAVCMACSCFAGCGSSSWKGSSVSGWGNVVSESLGGFIAETENHYFYINGVGASSEDNTLGKPTKGALYAVKKGDLASNTVAVPKLFVATDYEQGLYINGDYVYYGTPSTDKNSDGDIANSEMMFTRSKLDGTETTTLFTVDSLSLEHRFTEKDGKISIAYYDSTDSAVMVYDVSAGKDNTVAKIDEKADTETLKAHAFADKVGADGLVLAYATTVYSEPYNEKMLEETGGTRGTETYNNVYALTAGETQAQVIYEGKAGSANYAITMIKGGYVYYTKTVGGATKNYAVSTADFMQKKEGVEIVADYAVKTNLIVSLDEVYTVAEGKVYKDTMVKANSSNASKVLVAKNEKISSLLFVHGTNLYFYDSANNISRIELSNEDANVVRVSQDTVSTTWFAPEIVNFNGKDTLFYVDNSSYGLSYIKYVDMTGDVKAEDTDDDGENDSFYLEGHEFLSVLSGADKAKIMDSTINALDTKLDGGKLVFEEAQGKLVVKAVEDARKAYDKLSKEVKDAVSESALTKLANMEKAIEIANLLNKLDGIYNIDMLDDAGKALLKTAYETIKGDIESFYASEDKDAVIAYIDNNLLYNFQRATAEFAKA